MTQPIPFTVTRYRCPTCPRTGSSRARITEHIGRCWTNPDARGCKTCKHFEPHGPEWGDACAVDVDLSGRPECKACKGYGSTFGDDLGVTECAECGGDGAEIKPGPIVHCDRWEADPS